MHHYRGVSDSSRIYPRDGRDPQRLVFFMHSMGSSGLAVEHYHGEAMAQLMPDALIVFPNGPQQMAPNHYSWFDMGMAMHTQDPEVAIQATLAGALQVVDDVNAYIDTVKWEAGIPNDRVVIAGHSQGGTMAFRAALHRANPLAGAFVVSATALARRLEGTARFPLEIVVGEREDKPYSGVPRFEERGRTLSEQGFGDLTSHIEPDVVHAHAVTRNVIERLAHFTHRVTANGVSHQMHAAPEPHAMGF